jgi:hypothetical protein
MGYILSQPSYKLFYEYKIYILTNYFLGQWTIHSTQFWVDYQKPLQCFNIYHYCI